MSGEPPGRIAAVLFDWAGTTVDHGSRAPARVFAEVFTRAGVPVTEAEARGPMGMAKRAHIATLLALPRVAAAWAARHGHAPTAADVDRLYRDFLPLQKQVLADLSGVIPGVPEAVQWCRARGLRVGSTTGYTRELMEVVLPVARRGGYEPEVVVCADEVAAGRPAPWLNFRAAEQLGVYPLSRVLAVDDTPLGVEAGRHAGCLTVAVSRTGNALGLSLDEIAALPGDELTRRLRATEADFRAAGAHFVLPSVADLPGLLTSEGLVG